MPSAPSLSKIGKAIYSSTSPIVLAINSSTRALSASILFLFNLDPYSLQLYQNFRKLSICLSFCLQLKLQRGTLFLISSTHFFHFLLGIPPLSLSSNKLLLHTLGLSRWPRLQPLLDPTNNKNFQSHAILNKNKNESCFWQKCIAEARFLLFKNGCP